jgi:hypothetical protein
MINNTEVGQVYLAAGGGKQRREVSNPCLTANNAIEIANYI